MSGQIMIRIPTHGEMQIMSMFKFQKYKNNYDFLFRKLNFFSNPGWPNSQADESDLGAGEWSSAGADHEDSKRQSFKIV